MTMETIVTNLRFGSARRIVDAGIRYLVAPVTMIVPGVLPGSKGPVLYPPDQTKASTPLWNNIPLTLYHPQVDGEFVPASTPGILEQSGLGFLRNSRYKGKLLADAWFDEERTAKISPAVYKSLIVGTPIEQSTGLSLDLAPVPPDTRHNGVEYHSVGSNFQPDHLAVLPDQLGACGIRDGCGILVNTLDNQLVVNPKGQWTPPSAGPNAPAEVKRILRRVYSEYRNEHPSEDPRVKARGAKIAWAAVKRAGWVKGDDGKWHKRSKTSNLASGLTPGLTWNDGGPMPKKSIMQRLGRLLGLTTNQPSHDDIRMQLAAQLRKRLVSNNGAGTPDDPYGGPMDWPWIIDVYDKYIVYEFQQKKWKLPYSMDLRSDTANLSEEEPVEVIKVSKYKPVAATNGTSGNTNNNDPTLVPSDIKDPSSITNNGDLSMPTKLTPEQKKAVVDNLLTANCQCNNSLPWHGKDANHLNNLSDTELALYDQWARREAAIHNQQQANNSNNNSHPGSTQTNNTTTVQEVVAWNPATNRYEVRTLQAPPVAQPVENSPPPGYTLTGQGHGGSNGTGSAGGGGSHGGHGAGGTHTHNKEVTEDEWMKSAPASVKAKFQVVDEIISKERTALLEKITANLSDTEQQQQAVQVYNAMPIEQLRAVAAAFPDVEEQQRQAQQVTTPSYWGGQGVSNVATNTEEPLTSPTYKFGKTG